jgi:hypothetical protein
MLCSLVSLCGLPESSDSFDILDFNTVSGSFDKMRLPPLEDSLLWDTSELLTRGAICVGSCPAGIGGDYNDDGIVDAADYTVWRDQMGPLVPPGYGADADGDGYIGYKDYLLWKDAYGGVVTTASSNTRVPEPTTLLLVLMALLGTPLRRAV